MTHVEAITPGRSQLLALEVLNTPTLLVDWNLCRYMRVRADSAPLLRALLDTEVRDAFAVPWCSGHLLDATAGMHLSDPGQLAERVQQFVFVDGLTRSTQWEFRRAEDGTLLTVLKPNSLSAAVEAAGFYSRMTELQAEAPEVFEQAAATARTEALTAASQMAEVVKELPDAARDLSR